MQSKEFNKKVLTPNPAYSVSITHLSLCVYISIRIGHSQQENIHFLQDGGDGWILPIIRYSLSRDNELVSCALQAGLLGLSPFIFPRCPTPRTASTLCSLPATLIGAGLCKAHGALQNLGKHGCLMTSTSVSPGLPCLFIPSRGREQGRGEPHIIIVIRNLSTPPPRARGREDGSSTCTTPPLVLA